MVFREGALGTKTLMATPVPGFREGHPNCMGSSPAPRWFTDGGGEPTEDTYTVTGAEPLDDP